MTVTTSLAKPTWPRARRKDVRLRWRRALKEVAHSEGPTYQNLRFPFDVIGSTLYLSLADPQSDIWSAEVVRP